MKKGTTKVTTKPLERTVSVTHNSSLKESTDENGNTNRLKVQVNVGKRSEIKNIQSLQR